MDRLGWPLEKFSFDNSVARYEHHTRRRGRTDMGHLMDYCKFLQTQDEAIEHCRLVNRGLSPTDPDCCAVVAGPKDNFAVVDLETAKDLLDEGNSGLTCLIVTD